MDKKITFMIILLVIGFAVAIQYNTIQQPEERDTRDLWAIRNDLANEKKIHSDLLMEIRNLDQTLRKYETLNEDSASAVLKETINDLYEQAGMVEMSGPGLIIEVEPSPESIALGFKMEKISPDLLTRFVNELNRVKWRALEIDGKRYTSLSAIRDINGFTTVNGLNISSPPFKIQVITNDLADAEKIYSTLHASTIHDDFYLDNLILKVRNPVKEVTIKGWKEDIRKLYLNERLKGE